MLFENVAETLFLVLDLFALFVFLPKIFLGEGEQSLALEIEMAILKGTIGIASHDELVEDAMGDAPQSGIRNVLARLP